jgi:hypothetical protein
MATQSTYVPQPYEYVPSPPIVEKENPNQGGNYRNPGDPTISLNPDGTEANAGPLKCMTAPVVKNPLHSDPAFVPSPLMDKETFASSKPPWADDEKFNDLVETKIYSAPGGHGGDYAFIAWLYRFYQEATGAAPESGTHGLNPIDQPARAQGTAQDEQAELPPDEHAQTEAAHEARGYDPEPEPEA